MVNTKMRFHKALSVLLCLILLSTFITILPLKANATSIDIAGINSGKTYYIKNLADGKYLDVYNGVDRDGTDVWTYTFNASNAQKWRVVRNPNGTYTLFAVVSSNNRALHLTGLNADIQTYGRWSSSQQVFQFTLVRETSVVYCGTYSIKQNGYYLSQDSINRTVRLCSWDTGFNARWSFEPVDKSDAEIYTSYYQDGTRFGIIPTYFDTRGAASKFVNKCSSMGYSSYHHTNDSATNAYNNLTTDSIWVFRGHGLEAKNTHTPKAGICFSTRLGSNHGFIVADFSISHWAQDEAMTSLAANSLAEARCVLFIGCSTGISYNGFNLVDETFNKGAHFVLGTTVPTYTPQTDKWTKKFFEKADTGATIYECISHANYYQSIGALYCKGDTHAKLK